MIYRFISVKHERIVQWNRKRENVLYYWNSHLKIKSSNRDSINSTLRIKKLRVNLAGIDLRMYQKRHCISVFPCPPYYRRCGSHKTVLFYLGGRKVSHCLAKKKKWRPKSHEAFTNYTNIRLRERSTNYETSA